MAQEPTERVTFDAANLTDAQADGLACVVCGASYLTTDVPHVPVGTSATGSQVFACASCASPAAAGKSRTWPSGEPETVRAAADDRGAISSDIPGDAQDDDGQRPSWLPDGCPAWCRWDHEEHDHYDDRSHGSVGVRVKLTAAEDGGVRHPGNGPAQIEVSLKQHYREVGPRVEIGKDGKQLHLQLTLDEAEEFAAKLLELVTIARAG